jgi:AAT family amino acid transporter
MLLCIPINALVPEEAFQYITSVATLGWIWVWGIIVVCHLVYRRRVKNGEIPESSFKLPFAKPLCWATLFFLAFVTVLLGFDEGQRVALYALPLWAVILVGGYFSTVKWKARRATTTDDDPRDNVRLLEEVK